MLPIDSVVVIYALSYFGSFNVEELLVLFGHGISNKYSYPLNIQQAWREYLSYGIKIIHTNWMWYDEQSGMKAAALNASPERYLQDFGEYDVTDW